MCIRDRLDGGELDVTTLDVLAPTSISVSLTKIGDGFIHNIRHADTYFLPFFVEPTTFNFQDTLEPGQYRFSLVADHDGSQNTDVFGRFEFDFTATTVPEPDAVVLLLVAGLAFSVRSRSRFRRRKAGTNPRH